MSSIPLTPFGERLYRALERSEKFDNNLTRLCEAAGTKYRTVYNYTRKGVGPPSWVVSALAKALEVSADDLLGSTETTDDRAAGTPSAEAFIAGQAAIGRPLTEEAARHLRGLRHSEGDVPLEVITELHRHWVARREGKSADRPEIETHVDERSGQRPLKRT